MLKCIHLKLYQYYSNSLSILSPPQRYPYYYSIPVHNLVEFIFLVEFCVIGRQSSHQLSSTQFAKLNMHIFTKK